MATTNPREEAECSRHSMIFRQGDQRQRWMDDAHHKIHVSMMKHCWSLLKSPKHVNQWLGLEKKIEGCDRLWLLSVDEFFQGIGKHHDGQPRSIFGNNNITQALFGNSNINVNMAATLAWFRQEESIVFEKKFLELDPIIDPLFEICNDPVFKEEFGATDETKQASAEFDELLKEYKKDPLPPLSLVKQYGEERLARMQRVFDNLKSNDPSHVKWWVDVFKESQETTSENVADSKKDRQYHEASDFVTYLECFLRRTGAPEESSRIEDKLAWFRQATSVTLSEKVLTEHALWCLVELHFNERIRTKILGLTGPVFPFRHCEDWAAFGKDIDEDEDDRDEEGENVYMKQNGPDKRRSNGDDSSLARPSKKCKVGSDDGSL